jgi:glucosyl-3-phosphoglycerate synthase
VPLVSLRFFHAVNLNGCRALPGSSIRQFHHQDFLPLESLARRKAQSGASVSLVLPALNEEGTVGDIVARCRSELVEAVPLLDEIVVVDGGSGDATRQRAREAGATVHQSSRIMPQVSVPEGKGASLWKSLFVTRGDIIVFIDADIANFRSHFVYGLVGALLDSPQLQWVKAFYRRPYVGGEGEQQDQGGRVTEILVRPLLSAWYPELAAVRQPLAGEYAFRREAAEAIPFSSGYGVELQVLLAMYRRCGLERFAQVDMGIRYHRNRPLADLGRMSFAILKAFESHLEREGRIRVAGERSGTMVSLSDDGLLRTAVNESLLEPAESFDRPGRAEDDGAGGGAQGR